MSLAYKQCSWVSGDSTESLILPRCGAIRITFGSDGWVTRLIEQRVLSSRECAVAAIVYLFRRRFPQSPHAPGLLMVERFLTDQKRQGQQIPATDPLTFTPSAAIECMNSHHRW